jgi:DNA anti-recombination protein RmuC
MINEDFREGDTVAASPSKEFAGFKNKNVIQEHIIIQDILSKFHELKREVIKLQEEVSKSKQRITQMEKKEKSYGKEVSERVYSMLALINDYGGTMTSTSTKELMGLSKDEFYRTLRCAKDENQIELLPNPKDQRSYIIKIKSN